MIVICYVWIGRGYDNNNFVVIYGRSFQSKKLAVQLHNTNVGFNVEFKNIDKL